MGQADQSSVSRYMYTVHMPKKRITIYLDEAVVEQFKARAAETGAGYQTMINESLKKALEREPDIGKPKKRSLAEVLLAMPDVGRDEDFARIQHIDDDRGDVVD